MKLLVTLLLSVASAQAALHSYTIQNTDATKNNINTDNTYHASMTAGTFCSGCNEIANMQPNMLLTCHTASTVIKFGSTTAVGGSVKNGGCKLGYFLTAGNATTSSTCTACEANCLMCSDATTCTKVAAGFYLSSGNPVACAAKTNADCKANAARKLGISDVATACPGGVNAATGADQTQLAAALTTHNSDAGSGCTTCPVGKVRRHNDDEGCVDCPDVTGKATGNTLADGSTTGMTDATITCTSPGSGSTTATASQLVAAAGTNGLLTGRKCALGKFFDDAGSSDVCTACHADFGGRCAICTSAANNACTGVLEGNFLADGSTATACTLPTLTECKDANSAANKLPKTMAEACPRTAINAANGAAHGTPGHATAQLTHAASSNFTGCKACPAGKVKAHANDEGCKVCPAITNSATGAVLSCTVPGSAGGDATATALGNNGAGRKCAEGYGYVDSGTPNVCTACTDTGCKTCDGTVASCTVGADGYFAASNDTTACDAGCKTCSDASTCVTAKAGFYRADPPVACVLRTAAQCSAVADSTKFPKTMTQVCPEGGTQNAQITDGTGCGEYDKVCPVATAPAGVAAPGVVATLLAAVALALRM